MPYTGSPTCGRRLWYVILTLLPMLLILVFVWIGNSSTPINTSVDLVNPESSPAGVSPLSPATVPKRELIPGDSFTSAERLGKRPDHPNSLRVSGKVVIVDEKGKEHRDENGELQIILKRGEVGRVHTVAVRGGAFEIDVPKGNSVKVWSAVLGDRVAYVSDKRIPLSGSVEIRARWAGPTQVSVVDAQTGADLADLTLVVNKGHDFDHRIHPGVIHKKDIRLDGGRSPLTLRRDTSLRLAMEEPEVFWVGAPGYTWKRFTVHYELGNEHRLARGL